MINGGMIYTDIFFFSWRESSTTPSPSFPRRGDRCRGAFWRRSFYRQLTTPSEVSKAVSAAIIICKIALTISFFIA